MNGSPPPDPDPPSGFAASGGSSSGPGTGEPAPPDPDGGPSPPTGPSPLARVSRRLWTGVLLTLAAVLGLLLFIDLPLLQVLALPVFFLLLPSLALAQLPILDEEPLERMPVYIGSIVSILALGMISAFLMTRLEGVAPAGIAALPTWELLAWTGGLTVAGLAVALGSLAVESRVGGGRPGLLRQLLPRTRRERGTFAALSFSAGIGEELAYRGYAYQVVQLLGLGPWSAAIAASVPFGFLHAYQGPVGVVRTGLMGLILAVPVVLTGSLLPSMAAHTLIDLLVGLVLGPHLVEHGPGDDLVPPSDEG